MGMRVAALYDVHGNLNALDAVLVEVDRLAPDLILIGGDVVFGPLPRATLERLTSLGNRVRFILGNADREVVEALERPGVNERPWSNQARWAAGKLTASQRAALMKHPATATLEIEGIGPTLFCHGTPRSDEEIITRISPEARLAEILAGVEAALVVCGHTHVQYDRRAAGLRIVNAGSVGMPFEGEPAARWAMLGPGVTLMRTPYDFEAAAGVVRSSGFPDAEAFVQKYLVGSPDPVTTSAFFEERAEELRRGERPKPP